MNAVRARWLILLCSITVSIASGGVGEWKTYTAKRQVSNAAWDRGDSNLVWVATNGGMFSYQIANKTYREFTTSEGLRTIELTSIVTDLKGAVWIGAANGILHRYYPLTNEWQYISDLFLDKDHGSSKRINKLQIAGDTLFILSDIGVSIYSLSQSEFRDTYSRFGGGIHPLVGNVTGLQIFNGQLWIATRNGIASTPLTNFNPTAPESWQVYTTTDGLPSNVINSLETHNGSLLAGTSNGLARLSDTTWISYTGTISNNILDLKSEKLPGDSSSQIFFITTNHLWIITNGENVSPVAQFSENLSTILSSTILGTQTSGLMILKDSVWTSYLPLGPPSNKFIGIAVDNKGVVWSGTGTSNGEGFMSFDGNHWRWFTTALDPRLGSNNFYKVSIGNDNAKWVSNWGGGIVLLDDGGTVQRVLNHTNGLPASVDENPAYVVVGGVTTDQNRITWITNRTAPDSTAVVLFMPDSSLDYQVRMRMRNPLKVFSDVVVDNNDTKWFANSGRFDHEPPQGLYFYNNNPISPGIARGWGRLTVDNGLTSNQIWSLAVDHNGELWIGSDQGITILFNPADPLHSVAPYHPLRDQTIQAILPDACDNKWVATKKGVFVLSPDGTTIIEQYTVESTAGKLLDDDITSIGIDHRLGIVYFGTEKGLSSLKTTAVTPNQSFGELTFFPNPYILPSQIPLTVDGLTASSTIKVLTVSGDLVKLVQCPCGRVGFWNGTNEDGNLVATGIYLIVAFAEDGTMVATGKLAVVRK